MEHSTVAEAAHANEKPDLAAAMDLHERSVRNAVRKVLGWRANEEDDIVQETFARLVIRLRQPGDLNVAAWLQRVAHNLAVDEVRRHRPVAVETTKLDRPDNGPAIDAEVIGQEFANTLASGLERLSPSHQAVLLAQLDTEQAGSARLALLLGVSVHAAESQLARARRKLRRELVALGAEVGSVSQRLLNTLVGIGALLVLVGRRVVRDGRKAKQTTAGVASTGQRALTAKLGAVVLAGGLTAGAAAGYGARTHHAGPSTSARHISGHGVAIPAAAPPEESVSAPAPAPIASAPTAATNSVPVTDDASSPLLSNALSASVTVSVSSPLGTASTTANLSVVQAVDAALPQAASLARA